MRVFFLDRFRNSKGKPWTLTKKGQTPSFHLSLFFRYILAVLLFVRPGGAGAGGAGARGRHGPAGEHGGDPPGHPGCAPHAQTLRPE